AVRCLRALADLRMAVIVLSLAREDVRFWPPGSLRQRNPFGIETTHQVWSIAHAERAVSMLVDDHLATGQSVPPRCLFDLQHPMGDLHGVVPIYHPLVLQSKDALQVLARQRQKGAPRLRRPNR